MTALDRGESPTLTVIRRDALEVPNLEVVVSPPSGPQVAVPLDMQPVVVGSARECDVVVADSRISRRHCELSLSERGIVLRDLGSKNGTYIRDVLVREGILDLGAFAVVGGSRLHVRMLGAPSVVPLSLSASFGGAIGGSVVMRALFAKLERVARTDETVLLLGESGTGKELLARAVHDASPRRDGPFEVFDCSAVAPNLIEAELFGHKKGAFTGAVASRDGVLERAGAGTLFLDELGELSLDLQPKLLRALESRTIRAIGSSEWRRFDARVVAATHRDLRLDLREGKFREDLYYRVAVVEVLVPPLRDRRADIPILVERFLAAQSPPRMLSELPPNAIQMLVAHDWPGNVRELRNTVARLLLFNELGPDVFGGQASPPLSGDVGRLSLRDARALVVEQFERRFLTDRLREHGGKVARAAKAMGVSRQFLHRLLDQYRIDPKTMAF